MSAQESADKWDKPGNIRYRDPDWLHEQYHEENKTLAEMAEETAASHTTIRHWMDEYDIARRTYRDAARLKGKGEPATRSFVRGYIYAQSECGGQVDRVLMHRLLAVAEYGFEAVEGKHVHHKINIPWLNYGDNVVPMDPDEHMALHATERRGGR